MKIYINQECVEVGDGSSVGTMLRERQIPADGTAVAINNKLVPKSAWDDTLLTENDKVTVIKATFGG